jgi:hypothetical protein
MALWYVEAHGWTRDEVQREIHGCVLAAAGEHLRAAAQDNARRHLAKSRTELQPPGDVNLDADP